MSISTDASQIDANNIPVHSESHAASHPIPLREVPQYLPRRANKPVSYNTVWRWARKGVGGVVLKTLRGPSGLYTTRAWIEQFLLEYNELKRLQETECAPRSSLTTEQRRAREVHRSVENLLFSKEGETR